MEPLTEQQIIKAAEMANKQQRELYEQAIRADERFCLRGEIEKMKKEPVTKEDLFNDHFRGYNNAVEEILSLLSP